MDCITLAILVSISQVWGAVTAVPMSVEVIRMKAIVEAKSKQLVARLNKIQVPPGMTLTPPADRLDGLSSVVTLLDGYDKLISDSLNVSQVKAEISWLKSYLGQWKKGRCGEAKANRTSATGGALQRLQSQRSFVLTVGIEALVRVKDILTRMLQNMEHLDKC
ncbi:leptin-like [Hippocampus zosterae]|uniref:leptin-like n=1 Tax=Hippocampus zosterae TaxID=109293 RepID=UPI00223CAD3C|nr:leptin-like [Hippocampus zosterae]XP_051916292.1 leptin-like [Hippocampus zosterae]XP_051916293.1 leptin-like [Hippocampus zosterae]